MDANVEAALIYKGVSKLTLAKDVEELVEGKWLVEADKNEYQFNKNLILRFRPRSGVPMAVEALDFGENRE